MSERDEDEDREAILARRARFVATALAGLAVLPACDPRPQPCLEAPQRTTPSTSAPLPMPCLSPVPDPSYDAGSPVDVALPDAGGDAGPPPDAGAGEPPDAGAPRPDASAPPPRRPDAGRPAPCLLVLPWQDDGD